MLQTNYSSTLNNLVGLDAGVKYQVKNSPPTFSSYQGFHHVEMWVGNAYQAALYYSTNMGFKPIAYKGLETGDREYASHVLRGGEVILVLTSPLNPGETKINQFLAQHGDAVYDVAFRVENARETYEHALAHGAKSISPPKILEDEEGRVIVATVHAYGSTVHSFVEKQDYQGAFLPGYSTQHLLQNSLDEILPNPHIGRIDHVVANQPLGYLEKVVEFYTKTLGFHRFWSVDDSLLQTGTSGLKSMVVSDFDETIKIPVNEPSQRLRGRSQTQEFVDFHGTGGIQHVAICVKDLVQTVQALRKRGCNVLPVPEEYYSDLQNKLDLYKIQLSVSVDVMQELDIVIDFDDKGYILQIFTRPLEARPTLFFEFMQRNNHNGFGAGNFKSLFGAIEAQQKLRGTLL
ncbi:MAG: 4-hydroxyphenylpyruvate dioxygenase [Okeania sp. SIO3B3]|nr:4-hydroxyphenylpyruvate dioxygenase [Okeania sp. SIO3B3]